MKNLFCLLLLCTFVNVTHAQWQTVVNGITPSALRGGHEANGNVLYIARVKHENGVHIGKARPNSREAFIPFGGKELALNNYEVFTGTGQWVKATANNFPSNAIAAGYEANGAPLYIARAVIDGGYHPGKARKNGDGFIPYGGVERVIKDYEVLTSNPVATISRGTYHIRSQIENKPMDVVNGQNANGNGLHLWDFHGGEAQQFTIEPSNEAGYYYIKTKWGRALDIKDWSGASGATLYTWDFHGGDNQKWRFIDRGNGYYNIESKYRTYIDVKGGGNAIGTPIHLSDYSMWGNNMAQLWKLEAAGVNWRWKVPPVYTGNTSNFVRTIDRTQKANKKQEGKETATTDNTGRFCTSQKVSFENGDFEALITRGIKDKIYPGAFYQLNSVLDGSFEPYNVARVPMELRIDLVGASAVNLRETITSVDPATVLEGVGRLLGRNTTRNSCEIFYYKERIQSEEQLNIAARAEFSGWGADVQAQFRYDKQEKKDFYLVRFVQRYFTVSVNTTDPKTLFQNRNTAVEGDPVYISSVDYGRIGMLKIETNESEETIMAALNASYSNGVARGSGQFRADYSRALQNARFTLFIYGGNAEVGVRAIGGIEEFDNFVKQGALYDRGTAITPISYRMSFLKDGKTAYVNTTTEYTEQSCKQAQYLKVKLCGISTDIRHNPVWGYVNFEVWELDSRGNKTRQVFPVRAGEITQMWSRPKENRLPSGPYPQAAAGYAQEITNVGVEWEFYVDPAKMSNNQILLVTKCRLEAEHKDNDFAAPGWHGMGNEEARETRLGDLLRNTQRQNQLEGDNNSRILVAGPYQSNTDRPHAYRAQFKITAGN